MKIFQMLSAATVLGTAVAFADSAEPQVSDVRVSQDEDRIVTVDYHLDADAYVTMDVLTNHVPIAAANVSNVQGDCNRLVLSGDHRITWDAVKGWPGHSFGPSVVSVRLTATAADVSPAYMVVNLETKEIAYYDTVDRLPGGLADRRYRTTSLVMKKVSAAGRSFTMGANPNHTGAEGPYCEVSFLHDYYLAVYETTRRQYALLGGTEPADRRAPVIDGDDSDQCPVTGLTYNQLRGVNSNWPAAGYPGVGGALKAMQDEFGIPFDLPTEAQWEYACRAGTTAALYSGKSNTSQYSNSDVAELAWYYYNSDNGTKVHAVGGKPANPWGFYDMYGNVLEWCLDWSGALPPSATEPAGAQSGTHRIWRGGHFTSFSNSVASGYRGSTTPDAANMTYGFRLCVTIP